MKTIPHILTLATILIHSVFGCCWHHAHACETDHVDVETTVAHDHGHSHDTPDSDESIPVDHHDGDHSEDDGCDEGSCTFISAARGDIESQLDSVMLVPTLLNIACTVTLQLTQHGGFGANNSPLQSVSEPLCALTQVWLL